MATFTVESGGDVLASGSEFLFVAAAILECRKCGMAYRVLYQDGATLAVDLDRFEQDDHLETVVDHLSRLLSPFN